MRRARDPWGHDYRVLGFPPGMPDGVWAAGHLRDLQGTGWMQLHGEAGAQPIVGGFSGTPVWDDTAGAVVGMTVATDTSRTVTTAYGIPIEQVTGVLPAPPPALDEVTPRRALRRWATAAVVIAVVAAAAVATVALVHSDPTTNTAAIVPPSVPPAAATPPAPSSSAPPAPTTSTTTPPRATPSSASPVPAPPSSAAPSLPAPLPADKVPPAVIKQCPELYVCFWTGPDFTGEFHAVPMDHYTGSRCRPLGFTARSVYSNANENQAIYPGGACGPGRVPLYIRSAYSPVEVHSFMHS